MLRTDCVSVFAVVIFQKSHLQCRIFFLSLAVRRVDYWIVTSWSCDELTGSLYACTVKAKFHYTSWLASVMEFSFKRIVCIVLCRLLWCVGSASWRVFVVRCLTMESFLLSPPLYLMLTLMPYCTRMLRMIIVCVMKSRGLLPRPVCRHISPLTQLWNALSGLVMRSIIMRV